MCLMNGKNNDGGIHPLDISVPLSCASASHSHSAVLFFFLLRAGPPAPAPAMPKIPLNKRAPSACPYFYILADERRGNRCVKCFVLYVRLRTQFSSACSTSCSCSACDRRLVAKLRHCRRIIVQIFGGEDCNGSYHRQLAKNRRVTCNFLSTFQV